MHKIKKTTLRLFSFVMLLVAVLALAACKNDGEKQTNKELDTKYTDSLKLTTPYEGKSFLLDGIGPATLFQCRDGDTAIFKVDGQNITVRFLGINTAETSGKLEPWGKPASQYTCSRLQEAKEIVLEGDKERIDSTGTRYLGWIWLDGRLLNLEILEQAYSQNNAAGTKYATIFDVAEQKTKATGRRIWGELDPTFDYSGNVYAITIKELLTNPDEYEGKKLELTGVISRRLANHAYLQQEDEDGRSYGLYLYAAYTIYGDLKVGNKIEIQGTLSQYNGAYQLTSLTKKNIKVLETGLTVEPTLKSINELTDLDLGLLVRMNNLEVIKVQSPNDKGAFTVTVKDNQGRTIGLRVDGNLGSIIKSELAQLFKVGDVVNVVGPLGIYEGNYQVMLVQVEDVEFSK